MIIQDTKDLQASRYSVFRRFVYRATVGEYESHRSSELRFHFDCVKLVIVCNRPMVSVPVWLISCAGLHHLHCGRNVI
jgi:hypothetical protein